MLSEMLQIVHNALQLGKSVKITNVRDVRDDNYKGFIYVVRIKDSMGKTFYEFTEQGEQL